jgi:hypothetical protein
VRPVRGSQPSAPAASGPRGGQDHRQLPWRLGLHDAIQPGKLDPEHLLVQKEQGGLRLALGRTRNLARRGQVGKKTADFARVALPVEQYESPYPTDVRFLRTDAVMPNPNFSPKAIQEPRWLHRKGGIHPREFRTTNRLMVLQSYYIPTVNPGLSRFAKMTVGFCMWSNSR